MKAIDTMRNTGLTILCAAMAAAGCAKISSTQLYRPDETLHRTGDVTLCLSIESINTKLAMDESGHFLFDADDSVSVICTDGTPVTFKLDGSGATKRGFFKGTVPEGRTLGDVVVYPAGTVDRYYNGTVTLMLPAERRNGAESMNAAMVGRIGNDYFVNMKQVASYCRISVSNISPVAGYVGFYCPDKVIAGYYNYDVYEGKSLRLSEGKSEIRYRLDNIPTVATFSFPVPEGDISKLELITYDEFGEEVSRETAAENVSFISGRVHTLSCKSSAKLKGRQFNVNGQSPISLRQTSTGIWEAFADITSATTGSIVIDGEKFGFAPYSGAGGIGACTNDKSALPFYNFTAEHTKYYNVSKSLGETRSLEDGGSEFWFNPDKPVRVHLVYDTTRKAGPSYFLETVKTDDPNVLLDEQFDLFTCGGDANFHLAGSSAGKSDVYDGISAAEKGACAWNYTPEGAAMFDYPTAVASTLSCDDYIRNRGVEGWIFVHAGERPGGVQLNHGNNFESSLTTPALTGVSGTVNAEITLDISRFSGTSLSDIYVDIVGGGSFVSASVKQTAYTLKSHVISPEVTKDYEGLTGSRFAIGTDCCAAISWNDCIDKPVSTYTFRVTGLTAESRIRVDAPFKDTAAPRCIVFGIKVVKK